MDHLSETDLNDLRSAKFKLEYPGLTARIADLFGKPIQAGLQVTPKDWGERVAESTQTALFRVLDFAILTMGDPQPKQARNWLHRILVAGSGLAGGAAGLALLPYELPVSTTIILRSIADIARSEGHDISLIDTKLSCLGVLALGGKSASDDYAEEGYWVVRAALARSISEAATYIAERGLSEKGAPPVVRLITTIASRFSTVVTEEVAAKTIPLVGAVVGGTVNLLFMYHFQEMARGHFIVKRLEKIYGAELIEHEYRKAQI